MHIPLLVTIGAVLSWAALSAVSRILLLRLDLDPWAFSFVQLFAGGVALVALSGRPLLEFSSFLRPTTWLLGILRVLSAAFYTAVLAWVSVLEAGILGAVNVPMIAIAVWVAFGRRPARGEWLGHLVILVPIPFLVLNLEGGIWHPVVGLMLLNEVCLVANTLLAERHPDNVSDEPGLRLRFTGSVLLITAALFLAVRVMQAGAGGGLEGGPQGVMTGGIWDWRLWLAGAAVGVTLRAPSMLLSFWSIRLVGGQNYMAAVSLLPLSGMLFEQAALAAGLLDVSRFRVETVVLALGILAGSLLVVAARFREARAAAVQS
ncbi:hypothetical protein [Pelagibius sp. Alg239-R121]|uniref:EamA family transporter n=1 Tax=Pelagibius sp. Alg239-R121 TaxID=2993448 RepID=UPI0024A6904A|nr:hypothetical protein [Pelagibius sp. Alg239-R121]